MLKEYAFFLLFILLIINFIREVFGEEIYRKFTVQGKEAIEAEIVKYDSLKEPYKFGTGRNQNEYWSVIRYQYNGIICEKKIKRSCKDYIGRRLKIFVSYMDLDLRATFEFPYVDIGKMVLLLTPILIVVIFLIGNIRWT